MAQTNDHGEREDETLWELFHRIATEVLDERKSDPVEREYETLMDFFTANLTKYLNDSANDNTTAYPRAPLAPVIPRATRVICADDYFDFDDDFDVTVLFTPAPPQPQPR